MKILAFDTSTPSGSVALLHEDRLRGEIGIESTSSHSLRLLRLVHFLLEEFSLSIEEIDAYALCAGPGSFTGIRVGLSTGKALARASGKPVATVSSLQALALKVEERGYSPVAAMIDARKGEVFAALYEGNDIPKALVPEGAYRPEDFLSLLPPRDKIYFIGSGASLYQKKIISWRKEGVVFVPRSFFIAYEVGLLGWHSLKKGLGLRPEEVEPIYYRPSQAEEKSQSAPRKERSF